MRKLKQQIQRFYHDQKGYFSILFVILAFVAVLVITGIVDILKESFTINEVQGIMDVAGVSALDASVDDELLREEIFEYNEDVAKSVFQQIIRERIAQSEHIDSYQIVKLDVIHQQKSNFGLGEGNVKAEQLILDGTIRLTVKTSEVFDLVPEIEKLYYRSYNNDNFTVTVSGHTEDGKTELLVRSVTRLVYR